MEETLYGILEESKNVKNQIILIIKTFNESLNDLNDTIDEITKEMKQRSGAELYELREYKSSLLQMKTDISNQLKESKNLLNSVEKSIDVYEKVIQLKTGDIF